MNINIMEKDYRSKRVRQISGALDYLGNLIMRPRKTDIPEGVINRIAVLKFDRIGDAVLSTPALLALRKLYPQAEIRAYLAPWNRVVFDGIDGIQVEVIDDASNVHASSGLSLFGNRKNRKNITDKLKDFSPQLGIDLQGSPLIVRALWSAGVPYRVGFKRKLLSFLLTHPVTHEDGMHQSEIYLQIPLALGFSERWPWPTIPIPETAEKKVEQIIRTHSLKSYLAMHLGSGRSYRRWPLSNFVEFGRQFLEKYPARKLVLIGGGEDDIFAKSFLARVGDMRDKKSAPRIVNLIGQLSIPETVVLLKNADIFIGNESGPMHLASVCGTPSVVFMNGWSGIERWKPLGDEVVILEAKPIHKCEGPACKSDPCPNMAAITVGEALQAVETILRPSTGASSLNDKTHLKTASPRQSKPLRSRAL